MVCGDAPPMGNAGGAVLVSAGIAAVGIALRMSNQDGQIRIIDIFVHEHMIPLLGVAKVHHVLAVLTVVAGDLPRGIKFIKEITEHGFHLRNGCAGMQAVRK